MELKKGLNVENAVRLFDLAEKFNAVDLLRVVKTFIKENVQKIRNTEGWEDMKLINSEFFSELTNG